MVENSVTEFRNSSGYYYLANFLKTIKVLMLDVLAPGDHISQHTSMCEVVLQYQSGGSVE